MPCRTLSRIKQEHDNLKRKTNCIAKTNHKTDRVPLFNTLAATMKQISSIVHRDKSSIVETKAKDSHINPRPPSIPRPSKLAGIVKRRPKNIKKENQVDNLKNKEKEDQKKCRNQALIRNKN